MIKLAWPIGALVVAALVALSGCGSNTSPVARVPATPPASSALVTSPPAPSPVSATANLTGRCVMGSMPGGQGAVFVPGAPENQTLDGTYYAATQGYELTLTKASTNTADIDGFVAVFYDSSKAELGSDQQNVTETLLTTGQALTWTEYAATDTAGDGGSLGDAAIPADAASCALVEWYHQ